MGRLNAPTAPLLSKSSGSVYTNVNNLRTMKTPVSSESASMGDNLQSQINNIVNTLMNPGALTSLSVTDSTGALIGWIGSQVVDNVAYEGGWFADLYIGGTGPANAVISATSGGVTIVDAAVKLTSNGLETDINNETLPAWGAGVSLVSIDTSIANGDQSFIAPNAMGVFSWDGVSALQGIALLGDAGTGQGYLQLSGVGNLGQISLSIDPAVITVTDGTSTTTIGPSGITSPLISATNYSASGLPGISLSTTVLTAATTGSLNYGASLTVNTSPTAVFGTPGVGQSNGTVVTGATLNLSSTAIVTAAASASHAWTKGLLTS